MSEVVERADPAIEPTLFRQLLGCFPTGVAVITTRDGRRPGAGTHLQLLQLGLSGAAAGAVQPAQGEQAAADIRAAKGFAINILSEKQDALSGRFASSRIDDKFEGVAWHSGGLDLPVIDECLASFECSTHACHEAGDHEVFIGEVKHMGGGPADHQALVFYKGAYMMLAESLRKLVLQGKLGDADIDEAYRNLYGTLLRLASERATDADLDAVEAAVCTIEQHPDSAALTERIASASGFFSAIAAAGHNEALTLMAQTMTHVLRERMAHVIQVRPRPDLFPLRRNLVGCLRRRDADGAVAALHELINQLRTG